MASDLMTGSIRYVAIPQTIVITAATSLSEASCCSFWAPPIELRREKVPFADMSPLLPESVSSLVVFSAFSKSTRPAAVKMTLLKPSVEVGDVVKRVASAAAADTVTTARSRK